LDANKILGSMSAITGIYHLDGKHIDSSLVSRMTDALAHRGPDGCDTRQTGPAGLGHCMLWTTPESLHEHLPLTSEDGKLTITADARIDNRDELIADLSLSQQEAIITDSSLILYAYQRWGESCVDHLLGDFAFAIWDQDKQHLFCARDHMGVKPFYYYRSGEIFAFASEIKALFCVPGIPREINEKGLAFRLAGVDEDLGITCYLGIHRLPPAHTMIASQSGTRMHRYWSLNPDREIHFETDEEYEAAFRTIFTEAVRCRMRCAFPVGSTLSGGLDSSSVVVIARHLLLKGETPHRQLHTFSAVFDEVPECDERAWMQYVIAGGDLIPHFIYPEQISPLHDIEHRIFQCEEPILYPTSHTYSAIYQTARESGVRVVLNGEYGDGVVSYGRGSLLEFFLSGKFFRTTREIMSLSKNFGIKKRTIIWYNILLPLVPHIFRNPLDSTPPKWIQNDFAKRTGLAEYSINFRKKELQQKTSREHHFLDLSSHPFSLGLEAINKNAEDHAVEPCFPFLDRRVVEFCLALPPEQRIRHGYMRAIERESFKDYLPSEIRHRASKAVADPYIRYSLVKYEKIKLKDLFCNHPDLLTPYINLDVIHEEYRKLMTGSSVNIYALWNTILLTFWLQEENLIKLNNKNEKKTF
jgi:asparagine synthase (glutamine-hydrolysing)